MQIPALPLRVTEMEQCRPTRSGECRAPACKFDRFNLRNRDVLEFEIIKRDSRQEMQDRCQAGMGTTQTDGRRTPRIVRSQSRGSQWVTLKPPALSQGTTLARPALAS
jgi:hypothetical protein